MTDDVITNMEVLKPSRKKVREGDIFVYKMKQEDFYRFGRVIKLNINMGGFPGSMLLYFYNAKSPNKTEIPDLDCNDLLIPPVGTNRLGWSRGYFETIENKPFSEGSILPQHHFKHPLKGRELYYDEYNKLVNMPIGPIGIAALGSYRTIDDEISEALGIPLAPD